MKIVVRNSKSSKHTFDANRIIHAIDDYGSYYKSPKKSLCI